jgi:hypothetical protein
MDSAEAIDVRIKELESIIIDNYQRPFNQQDTNLAEFQLEYDRLKKATKSSCNVPKREVDPELQKARLQEELNYRPFAQNQRDDQQNYEYVNDYREKITRKFKKAAAIAAKASTQQESTQEANKKFIVEATPEDLQLYFDPKYSFFKYKPIDTLPISSQRLEIAHFLDLTNIIIIQGNTGCGK